jgi:hypothetical protein
MTRNMVKDAPYSGRIAPSAKPAVRRGLFFSARLCRTAKLAATLRHWSPIYLRVSHPNATQVLVYGSEMYSGRLASVVGEMLHGMWVSITGTANVVGRSDTCERRRRVFSQSAYRGRKAEDSNRQTLFTGRDRRGSPVCGGGAQERPRRHSPRTDEPL